uniref:ADAM metallopeptidase domain 33 n=1 Tax=Marmota marmota marmota TaxID=9994 RepID=A0A8C6A9V3_MARMA
MGRGSPRKQGSLRLLLLLLVLLLSPWPVPCAFVLPGNTPGEPVTPQWVLGGRPWSRVTLEEPVSILKLNSGLVVLEAEGQELLLELEKNHRLLAPGYTETHYSPDGQPVVLVPNHMGHAAFHPQGPHLPGHHCGPGAS